MKKLNRFTRVERISIFFIVLYIILTYKFFYLLPKNNIIYSLNEDNRSTLIGIFSIVSFAILIIFNSRVNFHFKYNKVLILIFTYILFVFLLTIISYNNLNIIEILIGYAWIGVLTSYYMFASSFKNQLVFEYILKFITVVNIIMVSILLIQAYLFNNYEILFLNMSSFEEVIHSRNGNIRIVAPYENITLSLLLSLSYKRKKFKHISTLNVILSFLYIVFVAQTRMLIFIVITIFVWNKLFPTLYKKTIKSVFILNILLLFLIISLAIYSIRFDFQDYSYTVRIESIFYYLKLGINSPFGFGLLTDNNISLYSIIHGPYNNYYVSDVGIFGIVGNYGYGLIIIYIIVILVYINNYFRENVFMKKRILGSMILYTILTSFTLVVFNSNSITVLPIILAICDLKINESKGEENGK